MGRLRCHGAFPGLIVGAGCVIEEATAGAARFFPEEDLTGHVTSGWNGSLEPWKADNDHKHAPVPDFVRAQAATLRAQHTSKPAQGQAAQESLWFGMSEQNRAILVMLCTSRPADKAGRIKWAQFTEQEREAIAATVRSLARDCQAAYGLRA